MRSLFVVDMTNDFVKQEYEHEGRRYEGALVAPLAVHIIDLIARLVDQALENRVPVFYLEDEHEPDDPEFRDWPVHCVRGTPGALTVEELRRSHELAERIPKTTYNAFTNPELPKRLEAHGIDQVYITGLVEEVCIKENTLGALDYGLEASVVVDATVPFSKHAGYRALREIEEKGARIIDLETALRELGEQIW